MRIHDEALEVVRRCPPLPDPPRAVRRVVVELPEHPATIVPVPTPAPTPQGPVTTIARPAREPAGGGPPDEPPDEPEPSGRGGEGGDGAAGGERWAIDRPLVAAVLVFVVAAVLGVAACYWLFVLVIRSGL